MKITIEINSVDELLKFVEIIQGRDINEAKIEELAKDLNKSSDVLNTAIQNAEK